MIVTKRIKPYLFILPACAIYSFFVLVPMVQNIFFSLFVWSSLSGKNRVFVAFGNYIRLIQDEVFWLALLHNAIWAGITVAFPLVVGLILAVILSNVRGRLVGSAIYFIPCTIPLVVSGIIWGWIYNPIFGLLNFVLDRAGLGMLSRPWLADPGSALYCLIVVGAWTFFGFCTVIFLNALAGIDPNLYDVARVDGASALQCFFYITLPILKNTVALMILYSIITVMKSFDLVYITTQGGPGYATEIIGTYVYKLAFRHQRLGYAASVATILMILVLAVSTILILKSQED